MPKAKQQKQKKKGPRQRPVQVMKVKGPKKRKVRASPGGQLELTPCAAKYALALADPWDPKAAGACVPAMPSRPSYKVRTFTRGIVTIGTQNVGFIAVSPCLASNKAAAWVSTSDFTGTTITATETVTTGVTSIFLNNPFTLGQLTTQDSHGVTDAQGRMVSCGLSLFYVGTELNRGGRLFCYSDPDHSNLNGMSTSSLGSRLECDITSPAASRKKCWVNTGAVNSVETAYPETNDDEPAGMSTIRLVYPFSSLEPLSGAGSDTSVGAAVMCALITGEPGNTYEFEIVQHAEYVGRAAQSMLTPNESDPSGLALVQSAFNNIAGQRIANPQMSTKQIFKKELLKMGKQMGKQALVRGGAMLLAAL